MGKYTGRNYTQKQADFGASIRAVRARIQQLMARVPQEVQQEILVAAALDAAGRAMRKAPVETGHLRESGWVEFNGVEIARGQEDGTVASKGAPVLTRDGQATARISFNATTEDGRYSYALIQHEETGFDHPLGGEAKYLERAMSEVADDFRDNLARAVERILKRRGGP